MYTPRSYLGVNEIKSYQDIGHTNIMPLCLKKVTASEKVLGGGIEMRCKFAPFGRR